MERRKRIVARWIAMGFYCLFAMGCQLGQQTARDVSPKFVADTSQASNAAESPVEKPRAKSSESLASARALEQQGKLKQAAASYQKLARKKSTAPRALHRLAVIHDRLGDFKAAADYYQQALEANDADSELLCDFGYSCYLQGQLAASEVQLREALRLQPNLARAQNNLGLVLARMGRQDEAEQCFAAAGCTAAETHLNVVLATSEDLSPKSERVFNELAQQARHDSEAQDSPVNRVNYQERQ